MLTVPSGAQDVSVESLYWGAELDFPQRHRLNLLGGVGHCRRSYVATDDVIDCPDLGFQEPDGLEIRLDEPDYPGSPSPDGSQPHALSPMAAIALISMR